MIKLQPDLHGHFYMMDMFSRAQNGPRVTEDKETPVATLHESLTQLEHLIKGKVGKAFLKKSKKHVE